MTETRPRTAPPVFSAERIAELIAPSPDRVLPPTPEQRRIIEHPLAGSALVVAGAGSGKTETMASRVVWLVANGLVAPERVLGLTFTRKAAGELGERIGQRLERFAERLSDAAERGVLLPQEADRADELLETLADGLALPESSTYDSFAAGIVQEFGVLAGIAPGLTLIDQSVAWRLARETVLRSRDPELARSSLSVSQLVQHVLRLDQAVADNQTSLDRVERTVEEFSRSLSLPYDEKAAASGVSGKVYAPVRDAVAAVGETSLIARLARAYAEEKRRRGLIEFSDQLRLALQTVEQAPEAVAALRRRSAAVLLDEVQDTSVGQTRLLARVFGGAPVMAVGDPHQSIYGWRGASAEGLRSFHRDFRGRGAAAGFAETGSAEAGSATLSLSVSWRNPAAVLRAANAVAGPLRADAGVGVPLLEPRPGAPESRIEWAFPETVHEEHSALAAWMRAAREAHLAETGEPPTAAVLFRNRRAMPAVAAALEEAGVPARIVGVGGLLGTPEVTDVVCTLRCLWYADAGSELIRLLAGPRFRIGVADLAGLREAARWFAQRDVAQRRLDDEDRADDGVLLDPDRSFTILDALDEIAGLRSLDHSALRGVGEAGRVRLREAGLMLRRLRASVGEGVPELLRAVEHALRLDIELEAAEHRGHGGASAARANLDLFAALVEGFLAVDEQGTLASVLAWLERASEDDQAAEHIPPPDAGTVQLITMHGAKGLEWDLVAIPRMVQAEFPAPGKEGAGWLRTGQLPDELRGDAAARPRLDWRLAATQKELRDDIEAYKGELKERQAEEERRLAYVAITRAASRLLLTGSFWGGQKTPRGPSPFLLELQEHGLIEGLPSESAHEEDPSGESEGVLVWPLDPLGRRAEPVLRAAELVRRGIEGAASELGGGAEAGAERGPVDPTVDLLLAERRDALAQRTPGTTAGSLADRITASTFHEFVEDPLAAERRRHRPLPQRPYRRTRLGNRFHEWVERRSSTVRGTELPLIGLEAEAFTDQGFAPDGEFTDADVVDTEFADTEFADTEFADTGFIDTGFIDTGFTDTEAAQLAALIDRFERSRWADRQPIAVELEVTLPFAGRRLVCKLDAVYRDGEGSDARYEIVDWKSGRPPRDEAERRSRFLQLDLYRHAYAQWAGVDPERIEVSLFYVAEGEELRGEVRRSLEELEALWLSAADRLDAG
ncbi:MAG: ATP-dependent helicase [Candidatus Leucobacter sulfamidivorax]|nr:ATP-dependent helicase [Candidatus Leucobacter sulfamidivorax]